MTLTIRRQACSTCPYRRDTPPGVWATEEYDKLRDYDRDTGYQPAALFLCHHSADEDAAEQLCSGWARVGGEALLALRLGLASGRVDPATLAVLDEPSASPLYQSGTAAADAGTAAVDNPDGRARKAIGRLIAAQPNRKDRP